MADKNKVKFGLKNVHYAKITEGAGGAITYGTPVAIPGAVNLSLSPEGETSNFAADDNAKYYNTSSNAGYSGDLEVAKFPDSFYTDIFGFTSDSQTGVIYEDAAVEPSKFALLFEFSGDANKTRHVMYYCTATRPAVSSGTTGDSKEPVTETSTITAAPLPADANGAQIVRGHCATGDAAYADWYTAVVAP